jgi:hypothetical protein
MTSTLTALNARGLRIVESASIYRTICRCARTSEGLILLVSAWWTLLLLLPGVDLLSTRPGFVGLRHHAVEWQRELFTGAVAVMEALALIGAPVAFRFVGLTCSVFLWSLVGIDLLQACRNWWDGVIPVSTGIGTYGGLALVSVAAMVHLAPYLLNDALSASGRTADRLRRRHQPRRRTRRHQSTAPAETPFRAASEPPSAEGAA